MSTNAGTEKFHRMMGHNKTRPIETLKAAALPQNIVDRVRTVVDRCEICRQYAPRPRHPKSGGMFADDVNDLVTADRFQTKTTFERDAHEHWWVEFVDVLSGFCMIFHTEDGGPECCTEALVQWCSRMGGPMKRILLDNESFFQGCFEQMLDRFNIERIDRAGSAVRDSAHTLGVAERQYQITVPLFDKTVADLIQQNVFEFSNCHVVR